MCEYCVSNPDCPEDLMMCTVTKKPCVLCVLGNAKIYNKAKEREDKRHEKNSRF